MIENELKFISIVSYCFHIYANILQLMENNVKIGPKNILGFGRRIHLSINVFFLSFHERVHRKEQESEFESTHAYSFT